MDPSLQTLLDRLADEFREVREGVRRAVDIAGRDPEMALTRVRKVLELVVHEVYQRRLAEPPGTRPLENLLQRLAREGHLPGHLEPHANAIRLLGNVGSHTFGEAITAADVRLLRDARWRGSASDRVPARRWRTDLPPVIIRPDEESPDPGELSDERPRPHRPVPAGGG
jgi:hypothetical protein